MKWLTRPGLLLFFMFVVMGAASTAFGQADILNLEPLPEANTVVPVVPPPPPSPPTGQEGVVKVFGSQLFEGNFRTEAFTGYNPDYQIMIGDRISLRMWGAYSFEGTLMVDAQGNIFVPNVGPVHVLGVRNADLTNHILSNTQGVFRTSVATYANLEATQPVRVFVTGFVMNPGLYSGLSSDSVLHFLDKAGGVDPLRGSYLGIKVLRSGQLRKKIDLYDFLLHGTLDLIQMNDGDTIVVESRQHTITVSGEVLNPYQFEFEAPEIAIAEALDLARPKPGATHVSVIRSQGREKTSEYYALDHLEGVSLQDGDELWVLSDRYSGTILVRVEGAHAGEHALVLPYGARMDDVLKRIVPNARSNMAALQLNRKSVAKRQKEMLEASLRALENQALTARSQTSDEATLRTKEADLVMRFVERARDVEPKGQVVLSSPETIGDTLLEDGDVIRIPEKSSVVIVHGEVMFPNAISALEGMEPDYYIQQAGGYTQNADTSRILILRANGVVENVSGQPLDVRPGDEVMVLPRVDTKNIEIAKGITQVLYHIAVSAKVLFGL